MVIFAVPPVSSFGPSLTSPFVSAIAVIPARYASSRLPGKALADVVTSYPHAEAEGTSIAGLLPHDRSNR